jgi:hypothetical protein
MGTYASKYFGELSFNEAEDYIYFDLRYQDREMYISLSGCGGERLPACLALVDRYAEIDAAARAAILEEFNSNEVIRYYFKGHFDTLDEKTVKDLLGAASFDALDTKAAVEKLLYPDLVFDGSGGELALSADYRISKEYSEEVLSVRLDENLYILDFTRET